jgi:hypothetical protein
MVMGNSDLGLPGRALASRRFDEIDHAECERFAEAVAATTLR